MNQHDYHPFWTSLGRYENRIALVDERTGLKVTYAELAARIAEGALLFKSPHKKLFFLYGGNDLSMVLCYLSLLSAGQAVLLLQDGGTAGPDQELLRLYEPDGILCPQTSDKAPSDYAYARAEIFGYRIATREVANSSISDELALMLTTSGSTGTSKFVRLSAGNLAISAHQVAEATQILETDCSISALPHSFVLGLSVLNGSLHAGATIVLTDRSVLDKKFWSLVSEWNVTSLAGVPSTYAFLRQTGFGQNPPGPLRKFLLSGGKTSSDLRSWIDQTIVTAGSFYSMYGQTEACGRICVLEPSLALEKSGSVGRPVSGGIISCDAANQIIFRGPNVMLGYAHNRSQLRHGDEMRGVLPTGDLGYLDSDGFLFITGRASRFMKLMGHRINLDEVEDMMAVVGDVAVSSNDESLNVFIAGNTGNYRERLTAIAKQLNIPARNVLITALDSLPRDTRGKVRYDALPGIQKSSGQ